MATEALAVKNESQSGALTLVDHEPAQALTYASAGTLMLSENQVRQLAERFPDEAYEVKPTGEVYVSQVHYRRLLNQVFGPGQWALVPRGAWINQNDTICREYALIVHGAFVAEAMGETDYQPDNDRMSYASAAEGAKSNALTRCCKDLGIASDCWDRKWVNAWRAEHCVQVWRKAGSKPQWRLKDAEPFFDETGLVAPGQQRPASDGGQQRQAASPDAPPCPNCGKPGRASKYPKPGATYYCGAGCKMDGRDGQKVALTFDSKSPASSAPEAAPTQTPAAAPSQSVQAASAPVDVQTELVEAVRILGMTSAQASAVLKGMGYANVKAVPASALSAVMDALHAAANPTVTPPADAQLALPACPKCGPRMVVRMPGGDVICAPSKGGCGELLGKVTA